MDRIVSIPDPPDAIVADFTKQERKAVIVAILTYLQNSDGKEFYDALGFSREDMRQALKELMD